MDISLASHCITPHKQREEAIEREGGYWINDPIVFHSIVILTDLFYSSGIHCVGVYACMHWCMHTHARTHVRTHAYTNLTRFAIQAKGPDGTWIMKPLAYESPTMFIYV